MGRSQGGGGGEEECGGGEPCGCCSTTAAPPPPPPASPSPADVTWLLPAGAELLLRLTTPAALLAVAQSASSVVSSPLLLNKSMSAVVSAQAGCPDLWIIVDSNLTTIMSTKCVNVCRLATCIGSLFARPRGFQTCKLRFLLTHTYSVFHWRDGYDKTT